MASFRRGLAPGRCRCNISKVLDALKAPFAERIGETIGPRESYERSVLLFSATRRSGTEENVRTDAKADWSQVLLGT